MREWRKSGEKQNGKTDVEEVTDAVTKQVRSETPACDGGSRKGEHRGGGGRHRYRLRACFASRLSLDLQLGPPAFLHCAPGEVLGHGPFTH